MEADYTGVTKPQETVAAMIADAERFVAEVAASLMTMPPV